jgi:hypothetical protein
MKEEELVGVSLSGRALRSNLLLVPHKRISTSIPNAKVWGEFKFLFGNWIILQLPSFKIQ